MTEEREAEEEEEAEEDELELEELILLALQDSDLNTRNTYDNTNVSMHFTKGNKGRTDLLDLGCC